LDAVDVRMQDEGNEAAFGKHSALEGIAFGLTDGIICFTGLAIGIARSTRNPVLVIVATLVGGVADAFGNSIGFYISQATERSVQKFSAERGVETQVHSSREVAMSGVFTFVATCCVLVFMVLPFFFMELGSAIVTMPAIGTILSFVLGYYMATIGGEDPLRNAAKYAAITVAGAVLSFVIGDALNAYFKLNP